MGAMASQITSLTIVYPTVYSGADQRKHQSSALLALMRWIHRWPMNSPHKGPVTRKMFPFDDVIMLGPSLGNHYRDFLRLMTSQFKDIIIHTKIKVSKMHIFVAFGYKILCEISNVPFTIVFPITIVFCGVQLPIHSIISTEVKACVVNYALTVSHGCHYLSMFSLIYVGRRSPGVIGPSISHRF